MKRMILISLMLVIVAPAYAKHKDVFNVPCSTLWSAVKDTIRNSGEYQPVNIDEADMTATYGIAGKGGGAFTINRTVSVWLSPQGDSCEMDSLSSNSNVIGLDTRPFKRHLDESLEKLKADPPAIH